MSTSARTVSTSQLDGRGDHDARTGRTGHEHGADPPARAAVDPQHRNGDLEHYCCVRGSRRRGHGVGRRCSHDRGPEKRGEGAEDEVEGHLELVAERVAGLQGPALGEGGEVRVGIAHLRAEQLRTQGGEVCLPDERQAHLLLHEAVEMSVQEGEGSAGSDQ